MRTVSLIATESYLPDNIVENDFFMEGKLDSSKISPMFRGVKRRRHVAEHETAEYMIVQATTKLCAKINLDIARDVDMIITNISLPTQCFMGSGAIIAKKIHANPTFVFDFHHSGCVSFITMLNLAQHYIATGQANHALICNVQNSGPVFAQENIRKKPQSCVPGDGCGVGYIAAGEDNPILAVTQACHPENSEGMYSVCEDDRKYWQTRSGQIFLDFDQSKIVKTLRAGNRIVPDAIHKVCKLAGISHNDIDFMVTNQPSEIFLHNWRKSINISEKQHFHTFSELGNLFGAAIPINLTFAINDNQLTCGDKLLLAGFSHAGDFSAAALIDWQKAQLG